jgi:iron transport multicopper oxidase
MLTNRQNYAFFNDITYVRPVVPTLYTVMTAGELATNAEIYGTDTHSFVLEHNQVIEMVVNNHDTGKHRMFKSCVPALTSNMLS